MLKGSWKHQVLPGCNTDLCFSSSFNLKDIPSGIGSESRMERSKGENRPENILMDSSSTLINNDGENGDIPLPQPCIET